MRSPLPRFDPIAWIAITVACLQGVVEFVALWRSRRLRR